MDKVLYRLLFLLLALTGCTGDRCIDADDFGFSKFTVSSRYNKEELSSQGQDNEIAPWLDTGFTVNGRPLSIMIRTWEYGTDLNNASELSAWCAWYGQEDNKATLSRFCEKLQPCQFAGGIMCTPTKDAQISNAPCLFKNGVGLYGLIAARDSDPNLTFATEAFPEGLSFHLGEPTSGYDLYDLSKSGEARKAGGIIYQYEVTGQTSQAVKQQFSNSKLYFKILDKFYDDNNGQYKIVIKSGISDIKTDPVEWVTNLVKDYLFGVNNDYGLIKTLYLSIVQNTGYRTAVAAILSLYIMITVLSFLTGNINLTQVELVVRIIKVAIISALLSNTYSWSFFNDYLFSYFLGGIDQIIQIMKDAGASGPGSPGLLSLMIAPQTISKLLALLFVDWRGFIYIILFVIALYAIVKMVFQAAIIYIMALMTIGIIITMAPIFICFLLFQITRSLFENWLKQLIAYAIQPILLFAGIVFLSIIMRAEIYSALGFRVCKHDFPNLGPIADIFGTFTENLDLSLGNSIIYWWFPVPMSGEGFTKVKAVIPVPLDHYQADGTYCEAYGCFEERYLELPFLDPVKDIKRINNFFQGNFVQLDSLWLLFLSLYLLSKFNNFAVSISKFLSNTSGNLTNIQSAAQSAIEPMSHRVHAPLRKAQEFGGKLRSTITGLAGGKFESVMSNRLANQALTDSANSAVIDEVKRNYGLDAKDVKRDALGNFTIALTTEIKQLNPALTEKEAKKQASELGGVNYSDLKNKFAALKFGEKKKYADLSSAEKGQIDAIMKKKHNNQSIRELHADAKFAKDFQNAYIEAHQDMSARGIGILGKNIAAFRGWKEFEYKVKSGMNDSEEKGRLRKEMIYSAPESIAGGVLSSISGGAWPDYNPRDARLRTHNEALRDQQMNYKTQELNARINRESLNARNDILKPENFVDLAARNKTAELSRYKQLGREKLAADVYNNLSGGEDPALMGEKFRREKATDSQLRHMVDRAYEMQDNMIANDRYIRREDYYEARLEKSGEHIAEKYELLKTHYKRNDLKPEELPKLLNNYYKDNISINAKEAARDVEEFKKAMQDFEYTQQVIKEINERKAQIREEVGGHVKEINKDRKTAGMSEYNNNPPKSEDRKITKLSDYLKGL